MWTDSTRTKYERDGLRYATHLTDAEFALIEPYLPSPRPLGRPRRTSSRAVIDGILYVLRSGCPCRLQTTFMALGHCKLQIVSHDPNIKGFKVLPRRWVVGTNLRLAWTLATPEQGLRSDG